MQTLTTQQWALLVQAVKAHCQQQPEEERLPGQLNNPLAIASCFIAIIRQHIDEPIQTIAARPISEAQNIAAKMAVIWGTQHTAKGWEGRTAKEQSALAVTMLKLLVFASNTAQLQQSLKLTDSIVPLADSLLAARG